MLEEIGKQLGKHTKVADVHGGDIRDMHRKISESIGRSGPARCEQSHPGGLLEDVLAVAGADAGREHAWRNALRVILQGHRA